MPWTSGAVLQATSSLCGFGGSTQLLQLYRELLQRCDITMEDFVFIIQGCSRFLVVGDPVENPTVVARTSLRLCRSYGREQPCGGCQELHLCKFYIYGTCRFGKSR